MVSYGVEKSSQRNDGAIGRRQSEKHVTPTHSNTNFIITIATDLDCSFYCCQGKMEHVYKNNEMMHIENIHGSNERSYHTIVV